MHFRYLATSERGVSFLEFAIISPLILLLIGGMVDISLSFKKEQQLYRIAQSVGRIAASDRSTPPRRCCTAGGGSCNPSSLPNCKNIAKLTPPFAIDALAKFEVCSELINAGLDDSNLDIAPTITYSSSDPLLAQKALKISAGAQQSFLNLSISTKKKICLFCLGVNPKVTVSTSFMLEQSCT